MQLYFISLGCDKTLVDSEHIMGSLNAVFNITDDISQADVIAVNTCCFIHDALEESINTVLDAAANKKNEAVPIVVFGCMAVRFYDEIKESLKEASIVIKSTDASEIIKEFAKLFKVKINDRKRLVTGPGYYSYLKISDGCNKHCTYCVIPNIRGEYKSVPMEELVSEAEFLANQGVKELMVVAQETTIYGVDLYGKKMLHELLNRISKISGIKWIRLLYAYPEEIYDELILEIKNNPKICHYIDMPIQHCSDEILKNMARRTNKSDIIKTVNKLRDPISDICIRTTLISGFPGETDDNHRELLDFIKDIRFDRFGVFPYSKEENTPAAEFDNQVDEDKKISRKDELMMFQEEISKDIASNLEGKVLKCIVDGYINDEEIWQGRTYKDAPDIDGLVFFKSDNELISGDFVNIKITQSFGYDLIGEIYESTE